MKPKPPTFLLKVADPGEFPEVGEQRTYKPKYRGFVGPVPNRAPVYLFHDDTHAGAKNGQLFARGKVISDDGDIIDVVFDGASVTVPLTVRQLDYFVPKKIGETELRHSILYDISIVRRKTTQEPIHKVPADCGAWLDLYHFQSERTD